MWRAAGVSVYQKQINARQQWAIDKPKLENARKLRGIYFIDPDDVEFKETIKNALKKLEIPMEAAMPKRPNKLLETDSETNGSNKTQKKQTMHASWRLMNQRESVWKGLYQKITKIKSRRKGSIR